MGVVGVKEVRGGRVKGVGARNGVVESRAGEVK